MFEECGILEWDLSALEVDAKHSQVSASVRSLHETCQG